MQISGLVDVGSELVLVAGLFREDKVDARGLGVVVIIVTLLLLLLLLLLRGKEQGKG